MNDNYTLKIKLLILTKVSGVSKWSKEYKLLEHLHGKFQN